VHYMPNSINQTCIPYSSGEDIHLYLVDPLHYLSFPTSTFNIDFHNIAYKEFLMMLQLVGS
jgi:hypothetical protein